jgi:hypothetical protein
VSVKGRFGSDNNCVIVFNDGEKKFDRVLGDEAAGCNESRGDET